MRRPTEVAPVSRRMVPKALALAIAALFAQAAFAASLTELPTGGQVLQGQAGISQSSAALTVNQASQNATLQWNSFNIGPQASVTFQQPNAAAIAVNRILDSNGSQILGSLNANGQVFLINPNGVLFGRGAQVDVGGLVASTLDLKEADFSDNRFRFEGEGGKVENQGRISAGRILLLGHEVDNRGDLEAPGGKIELAAAGHATLTLDGPQLFTLRLDAGTAGALVQNSGNIQATEGAVRLSARGVEDALGRVVNRDGVIEATGLSREGGEIVLMAEEGYVEAGGELNVSSARERGGRVALDGDVIFQTGTITADGADGGRVELSGDRVLHAGQLSAVGGRGPGGEIRLAARTTLVETAAARADADGATRGGSVLLAAGDGAATLSGRLSARGALGGVIHVTGDDLTLAAARLDAGGSQGGGEILVGGDAHGGNPAVANADQVLVNDSTRLNASADSHGDGGRIIVWSERNTIYGGDARADAGATVGDGGFIEISSKGDWRYSGTASAAAPHGRAGTLLFDPKNIVIDAAAPWSGVSYLPLANPNPASSQGHGSGGVVILSNGNIVVASPNDSFAASFAGAAYLYDGSSGALISALYGGSASDGVGLGTATGAYKGVVALANGNFVVNSPGWGGTSDKGAVTWVSGTTGLSGTVSAANSLVGTSNYDQVGLGGITMLNNGNYVVSSYNWNSWAGAATWVNGNTGQTLDGVNSVGAGNSVIGSAASDRVGNRGVLALANGNYVVTSSSWNGNFGAATWGNGMGGTAGAVSAGNSLVGASADDRVAYDGGTALDNGHFVITSYNAGKGAATWMDGGATPATANRTVDNNPNITTGNSLLGSNGTDGVGSGSITALNNGNYVVSSPAWGNNRGAATWGNGATGMIGVVSAGNSLVGAASNENVSIARNGHPGVVALTNGNYVVHSPGWSANKGAVTWVDGSTANGGHTFDGSNSISAANSLVGSNLYTDFYGVMPDGLGSGGVYALSNGHYVVASPYWSTAGVLHRGAVTWGDGAGGTVGAVSAGNSLTGSTANDQVGSASSSADGITALSNGHYVVSSAYWAGGKGAVTWRDGTGANPASVTTLNSLTGASATDGIGSFGARALTNGNFVVASYNWGSGKGAATWMEGGTTPANSNRTMNNLLTVSSANSLVGSANSDNVGITTGQTNSLNGATALSNGDYALTSMYWNQGRGAVTWGSGSAGAAGVVSTGNSLTGANGGEYIGMGGISPLSNGQFVVNSHAASSLNGLVSLAVPGGILTNPLLYSDSPTATANLLPSQILALLSGGSDVILQASNDIVLNSALSVGGSAGGDLTLQAGRSVLLNANLTTGNGNLTVIANDTAAHGVVDAQREAGAAAITMAASTSIDAGTGQVNLLLDTGAGNSNSASGDITLGGIQAGAIGVVNRGPSAGSDVVIRTGSSLATGTGGEITLAAAGTGGGTVTNLVGPGAFNPGAGGRYLVYSDDPAATTEGETSYAKHYNQTYGAAAPAYAGAGNWFLYRVAPVLTATPNGSVGKVYDGDAGTLGAAAPTLASVGGLIDGDTLILGATTHGVAGGAGQAMSGGVAYTRAMGRNVCTYDLHADLSITANDLGYTLQQGTAANGFAITAKALAVSGVTAANKVYDGGVSATINSGGAVFTGLVAGDALGFGVTGAFADKHVGAGKTVTLTSSYAGADAGNYSITSQAAATADITPKALTVTGVTAANKVYDGNTSATTNSGGAVFTGLVAGDALGFGVTGAFADKHVGTGKTVTLTSNYAGADAGNYSISNQASTTAGITAKALAVSGVTAADKVYDGSGSTTVNRGGAVFTGLVAGDALGFGVTGAFADKHVGAGKTVTLTSSYTGADAGNYSITNQTATTANITAKALAVTGVTAANKVYDGNTSATTNSGGAVFTGLVAGDALGFGVTGAFADKHVAAGKTVTLTSSYTGADAGNYSITSQTVATADITPKALAVTGVTAADKVYDGNVSTGLVGSPAAVGLVVGDAVAVSLAAAAASFADKGVAADKAVNVSGLALTGADAGNYALAQPAGLTADITAAPLSLSGSFTANDKVYDSTATATFASNNLMVSGVNPGDSVSGGFRLSFADAEVGAGKQVRLVAVNLAGADAGNYNLSLTGAATATASITPASSGGNYQAPPEPTPQQSQEGAQVLTYLAGVLTAPAVTSAASPAGGEASAEIPSHLVALARVGGGGITAPGGMLQVMSGGLLLPEDLAASLPQP